MMRGYIARGRGRQLFHISLCQTKMQAGTAQEAEMNNFDASPNIPAKSQHHQDQDAAIEERDEIRALLALQLYATING